MYGASTTYFNPMFPEKPVTMKVYFWGVAEIGALIFLFFKDVDFLNIGEAKFFILGYKPRKILKPEDLKEPFLFRRYL